MAALYSVNSAVIECCAQNLIATKSGIQALYLKKQDEAPI